LRFVIAAIDAPFKRPFLFPKEQRPTPISINREAPKVGVSVIVRRDAPSPDFQPDTTTMVTVCGRLRLEATANLAPSTGADHDHSAARDRGLSLGSPERYTGY